MQRPPLVAAGLLTCSFLVALPAFATPQGTLPPEQTQGMVTYMSGGIGQGESQVFAAAAKQYPLTLEFVIKHQPHTTFIANVHVTVRDSQGTSVLDTLSHGPFILARLPVGYYTVSAEYHGQTLARSVHVTMHKQPMRCFYGHPKAKSTADETMAARPRQCGKERAHVVRHDSNAQRAGG